MVSEVNFKSIFKQIQELNKDTYSESNVARKTLTQLLQDDSNSMQKHNVHYDKILESYSINLKKNLILKRKLKLKFFNFVMEALRGLCVVEVLIMFFIFGFYYEGIRISEEVIKTLAISSVATFLSSFIILPIIIAKYLFNAEEDNSTVEIIKNIQSHDKTIREKLDSKNR